MMYRFLIKNYMKNGSFQTQESEVYSVPIYDETKAFLDPSIKLEMGKAGSLEFSIYPTHPLYDCWRQMRTIIRVVYDGDTIFRGRVITVDNTPLTGERKIHAEGDLAFFLDSQQEGIKDDDRPEVSVYDYLQQIIGEHNYQMGSDDDKKILLGMVPGRSGYSELPADQQVIVDEDGRKYGSTSWQSTMSALEQLQKTFGGVFRTRYQNGTVYLDWLENYFNPTINSQAIEVSENMVSVSNSSEVENIFTYLIPVGSIEGENLYLPEKRLSVADIVNGYSDEALNNGYHTKQDYLNSLSDYGPIVKVEQFKNADTEEKLRKYAYDFIRHNFLGGVHSFTITAVDLHHIDGRIQKILIGDRVPIVYPTGQLQQQGNSAIARIVFTATTINYYPHNPDQNEYVIGIPESLMSKEYGVTKNKKSSLSSSSSSNANALSSGLSSAYSDLDQFNLQDSFPNIVSEVPSYDDMAWTVIQNQVPEVGCWYNQARYNQYISSYPTANSTFQVELIIHDLLKNHMSTGSFGSVSVGPLTVSATNRAGSTNVTANPRVSKGVDATPSMTGVLPGIKEMVELVLSGYLVYIKNHPEFLNQAVPSALLEVLGGNGLSVFSSSLGDLLLPSGWELSGQGDYNISGASSIFTTVLSRMGINVSGGILSKDNLKQFLDKAGYLSQFLDSVTGVFDPQKLLNRLPENIRKEITNGELTKKASDWLMTKFPILKNLLGSGETQLTMSRISEFINSCPLIAPETIATVSSVTGEVSGAGVNTGIGTTINQNGIQIKSTLMYLTDGNGHVTYESVTSLLPRLKNGFVMSNGALASPVTLSKSGAAYLVKRFPELGGLLNSQGRIRLSAIEAYIQAKITSGELKNTSNPTAVIDGNTGEVKATGVELGADAEADPTVKMDGDDGSVKLGNGTTDKVELNGWNGIQYLGKDANGNWLIQMNEPIEYTDSSGISRTVPAGTIGAKDFYLDEIPSFQTKFAVIDQLVAGKATIGQLNAAEARITTLETDTVKTNELYVQGNGQYAGYIQSAHGFYTADGNVYTKKLYVNNEAYFYNHAYFNYGVKILDTSYDDYDIVKVYDAKFGGVTKRIAAPSGFRIGLEATENNDGTISIAFKNDPNGNYQTANFKIAATQKYINDVAAIKQAVRTALNASGAGSWSDGTKSLYIGLYIDSANKKVKVGTAQAKIQYPGENVTTLALALPANALDLSTFYDNAYDDGADEVYFSSESLWSNGSKTLTLSNNKTKTITIPDASSHSSAKIGNKTYSVSCIIGGKSFTFSDIDTTGSYNAGYDYAESLLTTLYTSANGTFTAPFGYSQVTVDVSAPATSLSVYGTYIDADGYDNGASELTQDFTLWAGERMYVRAANNGVMSGTGVNIWARRPVASFAYAYSSLTDEFQIHIDNQPSGLRGYLAYENGYVYLYDADTDYVYARCPASEP